jgi:cell division septation protein DedD
VTREEQPVDVRETARQATAKPGPNVGAPPSGLPTAGPVASGNGYFPEPRRVRTVSVRPDGTIIEPTQAAPAAPRAAAPAPAPQMTAAPPVRVAAATPPKTNERAAPTTTASTSPAATPPSAATRAASPQAAAVPSTQRSGGGGFAVQLAAPGSESEARSVISRIQQRYGSALGGRQPTVRKAMVGEREVFRVRVVGLSQGDANGLCERLKSAGGSCFVARE